MSSAAEVLDMVKAEIGARRFLDLEKAAISDVQNFLATNECLTSLRELKSLQTAALLTRLSAVVEKPQLRNMVGGVLKAHETEFACKPFDELQR